MFIEALYLEGVNNNELNGDFALAGTGGSSKKKPSV